MTRTRRMYRLIRLWAAMPESPRKERVFEEARRLCISIGYLTAWLR